MDFLPKDLDLDADLPSLDLISFLLLGLSTLLLLDLDDPELLEELFKGKHFNIYIEISDLNLDDRDLLDLLFVSLDLLLE